MFPSTHAPAMGALTTTAPSLVLTQHHVLEPQDWELIKPFLPFFWLISKPGIMDFVVVAENGLNHMGKKMKWCIKVCTAGQAEGRGSVYLSEQKDNIVAAIFYAGKAGGAVRGKHASCGVEPTEGRPEEQSTTVCSFCFLVA